MAEVSWGPWREHDGSGLPVPVGTRVQAEYRGRPIQEFYAGVVAIRSGFNRSCWIWPDKYGDPAADILRYRIWRDELPASILAALKTERETENA